MARSHHGLCKPQCPQQRSQGTHSGLSSGAIALTLLNKKRVVNFTLCGFHINFKKNVKIGSREMNGNTVNIGFQTPKTRQK